MDQPLVSLLPLVIAILYDTPSQSASLDDLCREIDAYPEMTEDLMSHICSFDTTKDALQFAMDRTRSLNIEDEELPLTDAKEEPGCSDESSDRQ